MFQRRARSLRLFRKFKRSVPKLNHVKRFNKISRAKSAKTSNLLKRLVRRDRIALSTRTSVKKTVIIANPARVVRIVKVAVLTADAVNVPIAKNVKAEIAANVKIGLNVQSAATVENAASAEIVVTAAQRTLPSVEITKVATAVNVLSAATEKDAATVMVKEIAVKARIVTVISAAAKTSRMQIREIKEAITAMLLPVCPRRRRTKGSPSTKLRLQDLLTSRLVR